MHSTTKFLNGHSDSVGGVAVVKDPAHAQWLQFYQNAAGAILSPFDSWLVLRGTKTLALRMPRHEENGRRVAHFLREQKKVRKVYWPGFSDHPGHDVHRRQASGLRLHDLVRPRPAGTPRTVCSSACGCARSGRAWAGSRPSSRTRPP